jgi:hypothetical protein
MALLARVFEDSLLRWYRQRLPPGDPMAQGGLFTVIQRSSGDMRLNPHLHVVALDGVCVAGTDGQPVFRELARLKTAEVADVVQITKVRVLKELERRGVVRVSPESLEVDDVLSARDPVLAQLAAAAVPGLPPADPAERKREPVFFAADGAPEIVGDLVIQDIPSANAAQTPPPSSPAPPAFTKPSKQPPSERSGRGPARWCTGRPLAVSAISSFVPV